MSSTTSSKIKYIFFDVGGVLLLDFSGTDKWTELRRGIGITAEQDARFQELWDEYCARVCIDYDVDAFISVLKKEFLLHIPDDYSLLDDFVSRFEKNERLWILVAEIIEQYPVGLLTNMYPRMFDAVEKARLMPNLNWDAVIDSSKVGCQKPQSKIYTFAEKVARCEPSEILFIDNTLENLEVAENRGWKTVLYDPTDMERSNKRLSGYLLI